MIYLSDQAKAWQSKDLDLFPWYLAEAIIKIKTSSHNLPIETGR